MSRSCLYSLFRHVCVLVLLCAPLQAFALDDNPTDPKYFAPPQMIEGQGFMDRIGPGQGPMRKDSIKADVHEAVEGYSPARRCLTCHEGQQTNLHYARTDLVCRDCHVSRPIAGIQNPNAAMFMDHRAKQVCEKCHEGATPQMASYLIHEHAPWSKTSQESFPALFWSSAVMIALAGGVFVLFLPFTLAWAVQEVKARGFRPKRLHDDNSKGVYIKRFSNAQRFFHLMLVICFMVLSVTGIAWMYVETDLGQWLLVPFGHYEGAILAHRLFGLLLMVLFVAHIVYILAKRPEKLTGPDSLVWTLSDFKAFFEHLKWVFGFGAHPVFDRWTWWQKFDYWAVWWGLVIVGSTGLILYDPVLTSKILPGWTMNVARWVHKFEALLAMGHIFIVHFFIESYRPKAFPLNTQVFHGAQSLDELKHEHPAWVARMEADGTLEARMTDYPPRLVQIAYFGFGMAMVALGAFLLIAMLAYAVDLSI